MDTPNETKEEKRLRILAALKACGGGEEGHMEADALLLELIDDPEIEEAYNNIPCMWYA